MRDDDLEGAPPLSPTASATYEPSSERSGEGDERERRGHDATESRSDRLGLGLLGRYQVGERLGSGGMGTVYEAYDPELDRTVAIKVLRPDRGATANRKLRLLREAKVMAKLSHPNVIHVYDVGVAAGQVFVAMELVKGGTLWEWLEREARPAASILKMFAQAGRGLAAAHDAGLVHRDFKPSNVMVSDDGRVLVTDFGLARLTAQSSDDAEEPTSGGSGPRANDTVTHAGDVVGTPAYMAPEQLTGGSVDARADQFGFCVSLWEALYGALPFAETTAFVASGGRLPERPSAARGVSISIHRALVRGLSLAPSARYPSMTALLADLARDPARTRRRWAFGTVAIAGVAALGAAAARASARAANPCAGGGEKMATAWSTPRRQAIEAAFGASGLPYAKTAFAAVSSSLDAYGKKWTGMYEEACLATRVRGEQSDELLDLRMSCLSDHLREVGAFTSLLVGADRSAVERAPSSVQDLAPIEDCADVASLRTEARLPADAATRAKIDDVRATLADARALQATGKLKEGLARTTPLADEAASLRYRPLEAEVLLTLGSFQNDLSDYAAATPTLERAVRAATAGRSPRVAAQAELKLAEIVGYQQQRIPDGERWADGAEASIEAAGGNTDDLQLELLHHRGDLASLDGRGDEALRYDRDAVARAARTYGETSFAYARAIGDLGSTLLRRGELTEALADQRRGLAIKEAFLGPAHPYCAYGWMNIGATLNAIGDQEGALDAHRRALAIDEAALGHDNMETARDLDNIGIVLASEGKAALAEPVLRDALAVKEKLVAPNDVEIGFTLGALAEALDSLGRFAEARPLDERALAIQLAAGTADSMDAADMARNLAKVLVALHEPEPARRDVLAALAVYEEKEGPKSPVFAEALLVLADAEREGGDGAGSRKTVQRALAAYEADPANEQWSAERLFALADGVWTLGGQARARAAGIAHLALDVARKRGDSGAAEAALVESWLEAHRVP